MFLTLFRHSQRTQAPGESLSSGPLARCEKAALSDPLAARQRPGVKGSIGGTAL